MPVFPARILTKPAFAAGAAGAETRFLLLKIRRQTAILPGKFPMARGASFSDFTKSRQKAWKLRLKLKSMKLTKQPKPN